MRKFAILLVLLSAAVHSARAQPNGVTAELQIDQSQYLPDEDVPVKVRIVNRSGQTVILGATKDWITFNVLGEHEYVVPKLKIMNAEGPFTLLSGQTVTKEFNPTPYFGFRQPGRYQLGATIQVPQWKGVVGCKPVAFQLTEGIPLPEYGNMTVGVPAQPGVTNEAPDIRHYSLLRVSFLDQVKLYFRLTDDNGRTMRVFPLARTVDFGRPEAQIDRSNNLHVLFQTGAHSFTYCVLNPNGTLLARQYHQIAQSRPGLRLTDDGDIYVGGGRRVLTWNDIPAPAAAAPDTVKTQ